MHTGGNGVWRQMSVLTYFKKILEFHFNWVYILNFPFCALSLQKIFVCIEICTFIFLVIGSHWRLLIRGVNEHTVLGKLTLGAVERKALGIRMKDSSGKSQYCNSDCKIEAAEEKTF